MRKILPLLFHNDPPTGFGEQRYWTWGTKTHIMAVINTTPDSFSDGGDHLGAEKALSFVDTFTISPISPASKVDIIDVGGYSTRPGAQPVSPEAEIARTVPIIKALRASENRVTRRTFISIDTFRGDVAQAALDAGADIVNDVYGLTGEGEDNASILEVVKKAGCPVVLMHSRGDAGQNKDYTTFGGDVIRGVREELGAKVQRALKAGVRRWNIIVDPGIGFSKTVEDNLTLIRRLDELTFPSPEAQRSTRSLRPLTVHPLTNMPVLVGSSRKSYLGTVIGRPDAPAKERMAATIAAHTAAIQKGADIVRVHDVGEAWDSVKVADALWR